jgi:hypothetical protein
MMTVFNSSGGNGVKKRTIIKSIQKVKERYFEIISTERDIADLVQTLENVLISGNAAQLPGKIIVNGKCRGLPSKRITKIQRSD